MSPAQFALAAICEETEGEGEEKLKILEFTRETFFKPRTLNSPKSWSRTSVQIDSEEASLLRRRAAFLDLPQTLLFFAARLPHYFSFPSSSSRFENLWGISVREEEGKKE